jgi:hypothetical protein
LIPQTCPYVDQAPFIRVYVPAGNHAIQVENFGESFHKINVNDNIASIDYYYNDITVNVQRGFGTKVF